MGIYAGMNSLAAYLSQSDKTQAQFASELGVDQATISKLCRKKLIPSLDLAVRIERATDGEISAASWVMVPKRENVA